MSESPQPHPLFLHPTTFYASLTESPKDDSYKTLPSECRNLMTNSLLFGKFDLIMMHPDLSSSLMDMGVPPLQGHQRPGPPWSPCPADADCDRSSGQASIRSLLSGFESCLPSPPVPFCAPTPTLQLSTAGVHFCFSISAIGFHTLVFSRQV